MMVEVSLAIVYNAQIIIMVVITYVYEHKTYMYIYIMSAKSNNHSAKQIDIC